MKTTIKLSIVTLMTMFVISCNKEGTPQPAKQMIPVVFEDASCAKTTLDGQIVNWETGDCIAIWDGTQINKFTFDKSSQKFEGEITEGSTTFYALYPWLDNGDGGNGSKAKTQTVTDNVFTTYMPSYQSVRASSFAQHANLSACIPVYDSVNGTLSGTMENKSAYFKFSIGEGSMITKVIFSSTKGYMSGKGTVTFGETIKSEGEKASADVADRYVICGNPGGGTMGAGDYYVAVYPYTYTDVKVTVIKNNGDVHESLSEGDFVMKVGETYNIGNLDTKTTGLTATKWCLPMDFVANNMSVLPTNSTDAQNATSVTVQLGEENYTMETKLLYIKTGNAYAMCGNGAYAISPVKSGKKLSSVVVVFKSDPSSNGRVKMNIYTADRNTAKGGLFYNNDTASAAAARLPKPLEMSHIFDCSSFSENDTQYSVYNRSATCMVEYIGFIYE